MKQIALGDQVKDTITGFDGIVVAITNWLNGCRRITIQPKALHEGKPIESQTFDENQLSVVKADAFKEGTHETGGPRPEPARPRAPR